jgi:hypothetical protein
LRAQEERERKREIIMTSLWRNGILAGLLTGGAIVASAAQFEGVLLDVSNVGGVEERIEPGGLLAGGMIAAEAYTREQALKPESQKSGYGIYTRDNKFIAFDEAGNKKALALLRTIKKDDDLEIEVVGEMKGDVLRVDSIRLVP